MERNAAVENIDRPWRWKVKWPNIGKRMTFRSYRRRRSAVDRMMGGVSA